MRKFAKKCAAIMLAVLLLGGAVMERIPDRMTDLPTTRTSQRQNIWLIREVSRIIFRCIWRDRDSRHGIILREQELMWRYLMAVLISVIGNLPPM